MRKDTKQQTINFPMQLHDSIYPFHSGFKRVVKKDVFSLKLLHRHPSFKVLTGPILLEQIVSRIDQQYVILRASLYAFHVDGT